MKTFDELALAIKNNTPLVWNDPDPIYGADYTITYIEPLEGILDEEDIEEEDNSLDDYPILIQYGDGSEAQVFLHEILVK